MGTAEKKNYNSAPREIPKYEFRLDWDAMMKNGPKRFYKQLNDVPLLAQRFSSDFEKWGLAEKIKKMYEEEDARLASLSVWKKIWNRLRGKQNESVE